MDFMKSGGARRRSTSFTKQGEISSDKRIKHQRIKKYGGRSKIRTAIKEEQVKLAQYLRDEKDSYEPVVLEI